MRDIKVTNWNGDEFQGKWNEKCYKSQIQDRPELVRIYIDNKRLHLTQEEYMRINEEKLHDEMGKIETMAKAGHRSELVSQILTLANDNLTIDELRNLSKLLNDISNYREDNGK